MNASIPNKIRFFSILMIFIMFFSAIPAFIAQESNNLDSLKVTKVSDKGTNQINELELNYWCDLVGIRDGLIVNNEEYKAECIAKFGPEIAQKRTRFSNSYVNADGLVTVQIYSGEINYETSTGNFEELDTNVKEFDQIPLGADIEYAYACEQNSIQIYFRNGYSESGSVLTVVGDDYIAWEPMGIGYVNDKGQNLNLIKPNNNEPVVRNNKVLYPGSYPNAADVFTVENHKLKHEIILDTTPQIPNSVDKTDISGFTAMGYLTPSPDLSLYPEGNVKPINGQLITKKPLEFQTTTGTKRLQLPTPIAYELNDPSVRTVCEYIVEPLDDTIKFSITTPYSWLSDPSRTYPVVIDPTLVGQQVFKISPPESLSNDTFIASNNGLLENENYGSAQYIFIGGNVLNYSGLLKFELGSLPPNDIPFESALLKVTPHNYGGPKYDAGERELAVHEMLETWKEGTGTINNPGTDGCTYKSTGYGTAWSGGDGGTYLVNKEDIETLGNLDEVGFNVENLVTKWRGNTASNFGLILRYNNSAAYSNLYKAIHSSHKDNPKQEWPKLEVTFRNDAPKTTSMIKKVWKEDEDTVPTQFYMDEVFIDPNNDDLQITLWDGEKWGNRFECGLFNATLQAGDPMLCVFDLKPDKYGVQTVTFNATDRIAYEEADIEIDIISVNDPPVLKPIGNQFATEEEYLYVQLQAFDVEGQKIQWDTNVSDFDKDNFMDNVWIEKDLKDDYKAKLVFLPKNSDVPAVYLNISIEDKYIYPEMDYEHIKITVANVNDNPTFTKIDGSPVYENEIILTAEQGKKKLIYFQAYDDDILNGDELTFSSDSVPGAEGDNFTLVELQGIDIPLEYRLANSEVAMVEWRPQNKHVGEYVINVSVSDEEMASDEVKLRFLVKNVNDPPIIVSKQFDDPDNGEDYTNREFINFSCVVDDPDLHIQDSTEKLNITWFSNVSKLLGYGTQLKNIKLKAGVHQIEILVKDSSGETSGEARDYILLPVEKAITLQRYCEQSYQDQPLEDDIEYSYNDKTKKFTVSQGRNEEANPINLTAYYEDGKLVIELKFAVDIELSKDFIIKIYLVTDQHNEPSPDYKKEYTSKFFEVELYQPPEEVTYGSFSVSDGFVVNDDTFVVKYSLADLEIGTSRFKPLQPKFKIFAIVKWYEIEYFPKYRVENFRYDSIGYGSAIAPPPPKETDDDEKGFDAKTIISISGVILVIIIILLLVFLFMRKKKAKEEETVIDFSKPTIQPPGGAGMQQPMDINEMFMSPFEQQFRGGAPGYGMAPSMPGQQPMAPAPGMGTSTSGQPTPTTPGQTTTVPFEQQVTSQQLPKLPPKQPQPQPKTQPRSIPQPQAQPRPVQQPQVQTQPKTQPQVQAQTSPQPRLQTQPQTQPKIQPQQKKP